MTSTPNNIASESWEKEFREKFEGLENLTNITDTRQVKAFISKTRQEAIARERERIAKMIDRARLSLISDIPPSDISDSLLRAADAMARQIKNNL